MKRKLTYQDWVDGKLKPSELQELLQNREIDSTDYRLIRADQEEAYIFNATNQLENKKIEFLEKYEISLLKDELIEYEIFSSEEQISIYKKNYNQLYRDTIEVKDDRYSYTYDEIEEIYSHYEGIYPIDYSPLALLIKLKYLKYLQWFKANFHNNQILDITSEVDENVKKLLRSYNLYSVAAFRQIREGTHKENTFKQLEWLGPLEEGNQIPDLYKALFTSNLIDCSRDVFQGIFKHYNFIEPVRWLSGNASELIFFILELQEFGFLPKPDRQNWQVLRILFAKSDGSSFKENFKTLRTDIKINLSPNKQDFITNLIEGIN